MLDFTEFFIGLLSIAFVMTASTTVWKFMNFSATHILREINFSQLHKAKEAYLVKIHHDQFHVKSEWQKIS